ncbi:hypothetical protein C8J57DRAFT_1245320 [Mycena rebaudengoi]|nr:hypothetical protein C8J57DRAFT_1245320 [Mycena rebaudengoi]
MSKSAYPLLLLLSSHLDHPPSMMLYQKPPIFSMNLAQQSPTFSHSHRRHPSAPPQVVGVVVQPTRTPGLLSLSKPHRITQPAQRTHNTKGSPKPPRAQAAHNSPKPAPAVATPPPSDRGRRAVSAKKDNKRRSESQTTPARRRQPSPDPVPPPTTTTTRIAVPAARRQPSPPLLTARSDPVLSHMPAVLPRRKPPVRSSTLPADEFPICDDTTDAGGSRPSTPSPAPPSSKRPSLTLPTTPPRRRNHNIPEPPKTAPLSSSASTGGFPFTTQAPPSPVAHKAGTSFPFPTAPDTSPKRRPAVAAAAAKRAKHLSDGIPPFLNLLLQQQAAEKRRSRSSERAGDTPSVPNFHGALPEGYFASSMFQNSPSPEELPPPLFA